MPTARAQASLADSELTKARDFLCEAAMLVTDVKSLLSDSGNFAMVVRSRTFRAALPMRSRPSNS